VIERLQYVERVLKFIKLPTKRIDETAEDLFKLAEPWLELGFDGIIFDRCFCGRNCGKYGSYYLKCRHYDVSEEHFIKILNDYCPRCRPLYCG